MKSSKVGRPVVGKPKTHDIKVRIDEETHRKLLRLAEDKNTTKAEIIRQAITQFIE